MKRKDRKHQMERWSVGARNPAPFCRRVGDGNTNNCEFIWSFAQIMLTLQPTYLFIHFKLICL